MILSLKGFLIEYDAINRKIEQISNLEGQISDLQYKMSSIRNREYINNMYRWIDEKKPRFKNFFVNHVEVCLAERT